MPRPRIDEYWTKRIEMLVEAYPDGISGAEIRRRLIRETKHGKTKPPTPVPSDRAIRRIMAEELAKPETERLRYRFFSWPESMGTQELPWEASRACLDLLRFRREKGMAGPFVIEAQWFWRVTCAAPDAPLEHRVNFARSLTMNELARERSPQVAIHAQWALAFQPWSPENKQAYRSLPEELRKPGFVSIDLLDAAILLNESGKPYWLRMPEVAEKLKPESNPKKRRGRK